MQSAVICHSQVNRNKKKTMLGDFSFGLNSSLQLNLTS